MVRYSFVVMDSHHLLSAGFAGAPRKPARARSQRDLECAQSMVATGVLFALNLDVAATLLKKLTLHTWMQFGAFAIVFAIRTIVRWSFRRRWRKVGPLAQ